MCIKIDGFIKAIAPKEFPSDSTMPRLRCIQTAVEEYNLSHEEKINKHVVERCMQSDKVFKYKHGNRWIINYDELEPIVDEYLAKKDDEEADEENKKTARFCLNLRSNGLPAGSRTRNADLGGPGYIHLTTDSY